MRDVALVPHGKGLLEGVAFVFLSSPSLSTKPGVINQALCLLSFQVFKTVRVTSCPCEKDSGSLSRHPGGTKSIDSPQCVRPRRAAGVCYQYNATFTARGRRSSATQKTAAAVTQLPLPAANNSAWCSSKFRVLSLGLLAAAPSPAQARCQNARSQL